MTYDLSMARSTRPPPKASGSQKRYEFGPPEPEKITLIVCPICIGKGLVSPAVAAAINKLLEQAGDGPLAEPARSPRRR